jgi:large subunit ribosomal protein LX
MKAYRVSGTAPFGSQRQQFSYDLPAEDVDAATNKVYSLLGSRHRVTRRSINIESIGEIDPRTSKEPTVLHHFRDEIAAKGGVIAQAAAEEE